MRRRTIWPLALLLTGLLACSDQPAPTSGAAPAEPTRGAAPAADTTLSLHHAIEGDRVRVELHYHRPPGQEGPRAVEVFLRPSENLRHLVASPLSAAEEADKELVVQAREDGSLRVILYATTNLNTLDSGGLAALEMAWDGAPARVDIDAERVGFAPSRAMAGLRLPEPLTIEGGR